MILLHHKETVLMYVRIEQLLWQCEREMHFILRTVSDDKNSVFLIVL